MSKSVYSIEKAMKYLLISFFPLFLQHVVKAGEIRDLLQKKATPEQVRSALLQKQQWIKYPNYTDRAGWDMLTGEFKEELIKEGENNLKYEWRVVKASEYLEYERSGSRVAMEAPFTSNANALAQLVLAELAEGKGRFTEQIVNGLWQFCEMSSWVLSAHLGIQKSRRSLPDHSEVIIDLTSGDIGSFVSWTHHFLNQEFDRINPVISARLRHEVRKRILDPYMERSDYWWQALNAGPNTMVNNWNPWCNFNVLTCFLLMEDDPTKQAAGVHKTMVSVDKFINYTKSDGACEEGPSYWGHAAAKMYDYLQLLSDATGGKISIFEAPLIRNMGEYICRSYVGNGWVVNFADASAKGGGDPGVIHRYGTAVGSDEMQSFASFLLKSRAGKYEVASGRDIFRALENLRGFTDLKQTTPVYPNARFSWYPETQFCYIRNNAGFFLAALGGHNAESHNHNDVGTFSLYLNNTPLFIDVGVGTYTRQTFSSERYSIWTMQSDYHNLPKINGQRQLFGSQYRSTNMIFDSSANKLSLDISAAYTKGTADSWRRTFVLEPNGGLTLNDEFRIDTLKAVNIMYFMTWAQPDISVPGQISFEKDGTRAKLVYNKTIFDAATEAIRLDDKRLSNVWGSEIYRITLTARKMQRTGSYTFKVVKN